MGKENPEQATPTGQEPEQGELSGMRDYLEKFQRDQETTRATEKKKTEAPCENCPEESETTKESPDEEVQKQEESTEGPKTTPQYLIDDKNPIIIKVDGEEIPVTDIEKLKTYAQLGYHGNKRLEELNKLEEQLKNRESQLEASEQMVRQIQSALEEGRLVINKGGKGSAEHSSRDEGEEDSEKESVYEDPETQKLANDLKNAKKELGSVRTLLTNMLVERAYNDLSGQIKEAKKKYPKADDDEVWKLLAEKDEKTDKPIYNIESAVKHAHEKMEGKINKYLDENTEYKKVTQEEKDKIIADYLKQQEELEKAPVSSPSSTPAGGDSPKTKKEYKSFGEAMAAFSEDFKGSLRLGKKS